MSITIAGIMSLWNEEDGVELAIKSTKDFVDEYVVVDSSDDRTRAIIKECRRKWGLDIKIFYRPDMPDLAEKRYWGCTQTKADFCLAVDGSMVFHTDGPNNLAQFKPQAVKFKERGEGIMFAFPICYLYGPPGDYMHTRVENPILPAHVAFFTNGPRLRPQLGNIKLDMPRVEDAGAVYAKFPVMFDAACKKPKRQFLRRFLSNWRSAQNYGRWPTLEGFVKTHLGVVDLEPMIAEWWEAMEKRLIPYDEKKFGYYPKILREVMGRN